MKAESYIKQFFIALSLATAAMCAPIALSAPVSSAISPSSSSSSGSASTSFTKPIQGIMSSTVGGEAVNTTASGDPFILRSGYFDGITGEGRSTNYTRPTTTSANETLTSTNLSFSATAVCEGAIAATAGNKAKNALCKYEINTGEPKKCPNGFVPFVELNIISSRSIGGTPVFACVAPGGLASPSTASTSFAEKRGVRYATTYKFTAITSALETPSGITPLPAVSFQWTLFCYPSHIAPPLPSYTCAETPANPDAPPILWDAGIIAEVTASSSVKYFTTRRVCPAAYKPYFTIGQGSRAGLGPTATSGRFDSMGPGGICILYKPGAYPYTQMGPAYNVSYLANQSLSNMTFNATSLTIKDPAPVILRSIPWALYCYPPGTSPPPYNDKCATGWRPFL